MKISVITATYNSEKNIAGCLSSVYNQTYKKIEHIIIDGMSSDNTLPIIKEHQSKNLKIISEKDSGIYDALNKGIQLATGDIVGFLHSDDIFYSENTLKNIMDIFENKNIDAVYGDLVYVSQDLSKTVRYWKAGAFSLKKLKSGWMPPHPTLFLRKSVYDKYGKFDTTFKIAADYDFILRVMSNQNLQIVYLPEVVTKMRIGGASNKSITNIIRKSREDYQALKKNQIGGLCTLFFKNISKVKQFIFKNP